MLNLDFLNDFTGKTILTGDRPTGPLHLGHYVGSLSMRKALQDNNTQYLIIADLQGLTDNADNPQKIRDNILEVALDYLAIGIDPEKSTIFVQSQVPALAELTMLFLNLVTVSELERNPTVKDEIEQKGLKDSLPAGFFIYPVSQVADILAFKADLVPVGADQSPMIELSRDVVRKLKHYYGVENFPEPANLHTTIGRLPGLDGKSKMSKSLGNAIYLKDTSEEVSRKVMEMYTDPEHIHAEDPGKIEGNIVFTYLDAFDPDTTGLSQLKSEYQKGGVGDVQIKKRLIAVLEDFLTPIRTRRAEYEDDLDKVRSIISDGTSKANAVANKTLQDLKAVMGL